MTRRTLIAVWIIASLARWTCADVPSQSDVYRYRAVNRKLTDVLRAFAWDQRLSIVVDDTIEDRVISEEVEMPPAEFLDYITGKYGLIWYFDGTSLYIYRGDNLVTQSFLLRYATPSQVIGKMQSLNAYSDRFSFRILEEERVVLVVGPPRLLEMTGLVIQTLEAGRTTAANEVTIAVFPLTYASAADQVLAFQGKTVSIPGVATTLQSILSGDQIPAEYSALLPRRLAGLTGSGLDRYSQGEDNSPFKQNSGPTAPPEEQVEDQGQPRSTASRSQPSSSQLQVQPTIRADQRLNAVIVKDIPSRMETYRRVIEALDQPTGLIEITAKIIDINKEGLFEWGLPSDFYMGDGETSQQLSLQLTTTDAANLAVTLMKDEVTHFLGQIKALEQDGYARVASRPSLLTLDNVEAQIDNSETFYVRVEGDFEVDLFDVSIGTTLNVVPHIVEQDGRRLIKLTVQVEDGAVLEQTVDEIPRIRSDSITTQAVLNENESLLIGGLFREEKSESESRIPILGSLPAVGVLFRSKEYNTTRVERLILIEPRIVSFPGACEPTPCEQPAGAPPFVMPTSSEQLPPETNTRPLEPNLFPVETKRVSQTTRPEPEKKKASLPAAAAAKRHASDTPEEPTMKSRLRQLFTFRPLRRKPPSN